MKSVSSAWKSLLQIRVFKLSILQFLLICFGLAILFVFGGLVLYYHRYSGMIDARLSGKFVHRESRIFASPKRILLGEAISLAQISNYLEAAGYISEFRCNRANPRGKVFHPNSPIRQFLF
jgi:hypothetical protein